MAYTFPDCLHCAVTMACTFSRACKHMAIGVMLVMIVACWSCAADPDPLQDFCVGLPPGSPLGIFVNGLFCKNPSMVSASDFKSDVLVNAGNTTNGLGSNVTIADAFSFPGINMQGVAFARIDFAPNYGLNPPHIHARSSEILWVAQGTLYVGFVDTNYTLYAQILTAGEITVFPRGTLHFQINLAAEPALAFASFSSQNPGILHVPQALFASSPPIEDEVLEVAFGIDEDEVTGLVNSVACTLRSIAGPCVSSHGLGDLKPHVKRNVV